MVEGKAALRRSVLERRRSAAPDPGLADVLAGHLAAVTGGAARVAAYASFGTEPPTTRLLERLAEHGTQVLLPVLLPDGDLDWTSWQPGRPAGAGLGVDAVGSCDVVVVPALAVDARGHRLGRGGGSYDRALARVPAGVLTVALLHDGERVTALPTEPHDVPVRAVVTPADGVVRCPDGVVRW